MFLGLQALWEDHVRACLDIRSCLREFGDQGIESRFIEKDLAKLFGKTLSGIKGINWDSCSFHSSVKAFTWPEQMGLSAGDVTLNSPKAGLDMKSSLKFPEVPTQQLRLYEHKQ